MCQYSSCNSHKKVKQQQQQRKNVLLVSMYIGTIFHCALENFAITTLNYLSLADIC